MSKDDFELLQVDGREVRVTHPGKLYFSRDVQVSKIDLVRYYLSVAPGAVAGIRDRPIVLKRFVNGAEGEPFYQKRAPADHPEWPSLPLWADKHKVEEYLRQSKMPATFVYTGIYNNNFTSLSYPLFCTELMPDGSFRWQAPFHEEAKLPWLDAEHDVGPAVIQIFKDGPSKWGGERIALAYEYLSPKEVCKLFSKGVGRPVRYVRGSINIKVRIPTGYRQQLETLEKLFNKDEEDAKKQPPYFGDPRLEASCPSEALELWEGPRGIEEYAREMFPLEEESNGQTWMLEDEEYRHRTIDDGTKEATIAVEQLRIADDDDDDDDDEGLIMRGPKREEEQWLA